MLARKPAGGTWSAPISIGASSFNTKVVGVDGAGNVTAAGTTGPGTNAPGTITVTTWAAGAATPTSVTLPGTDVLLRSMAVSASGNVVIGATHHVSGGTFDVVLYYRAGPTGAFSMQSYAPGAANISYQDPSVAVNNQGDAVAAFTSYAGFNAGQALATVRTTAGRWGPLQQLGVDNTIASYTAPVGIDSGGTALAAYSNAAQGNLRRTSPHHRRVVAGVRGQPDGGNAGRGGVGGHEGQRRRDRDALLDRVTGGERVDAQRAHGVDRSTRTPSGPSSRSRAVRLSPSRHGARRRRPSSGRLATGRVARERLPGPRARARGCVGGHPRPLGTGRELPRAQGRDRRPWPRGSRQQLPRGRAQADDDVEPRPRGADRLPHGLRDRQRAGGRRRHAGSDREQRQSSLSASWTSGAG